ncbi:MAG: LysM peptidoglycan-binding domain-containing protein [Dehalococcoidia bacterium]|nr:LysM peptidoglycan-binding domain-containing protein [Dehalococcoidia bacterium]
MRSVRANAALTLLALGAVALAACAGDDDDDLAPLPTTPATVTTAAAATAGPATPSPAATAPRTPTRTPAETLARTASHVLVAAGPGDTWESIAAALGSKAKPAELQQANGIAAGALAPGTKVAVPIDPENGIVPATALAAALAKGGGSRPTLYLPGEATIDGFRGRIALHALELANGDTANEGYGYRLEFFATASASTKGGVLDPAAAIDTPLFTIAAGPFAAKLTSVRPGDRYTWTRDGIDFALRMDGEGPGPEQLLATLDAR